MSLRIVAVTILGRRDQHFGMRDTSEQFADQVSHPFLFGQHLLRTLHPLELRLHLRQRGHPHITPGMKVEADGATLGPHTAIPSGELAQPVVCRSVIGLSVATKSPGDRSKPNEKGRRIGGQEAQ